MVYLVKHIYEVYSVMSKIFCYNSNMPAYFEKKEAALAAKIEPSIKRQLESIAAKEDRTVSYVVGALLVRGLKLYARDGNLRDAEDLQTKEFDIGAAITSGKAPDVIINDWLVFDGCEPYEDLGVSLFGGWAGLDHEGRIAAIEDVRRSDRGSSRRSGRGRGT